MPIIWRESMTIGHPTIDSQHKYLFCLINAVELAMQVENPAKVTGFYLDQLIEYTRIHFEDEEKIQIAINYPQHYEHKSEHREIIENLKDLKARLLPETANPEMTESAGQVEEARLERMGDKTLADVVDFLRHWILDHVLHTDIQMKPYLRSQKIDPTRNNPVFRSR